MTTLLPANQVFTPTTTATHTFVERENLNRRLVNALKTPGKQIVVYGRTGGGKSTLLENKLRQVYEHHVSTKCMSGTTFEQCLLDAFLQLSDYIEEVPQRTKTVVTGSVGIQYAAVKTKLSIGKSVETEQGRSELPPELTPNLIARLLGRSRACWLLEDFHKVALDQRTLLAQSMKLFKDMSSEQEDIRVIAIGAVGSAGQVVECDAEMQGRVAEIEVDLMGPDEILQIVDVGASLLNVVFPPDIREAIVPLSNGLPAVCHQLCLTMCQNAGIFQTVKASYEFTTDEFRRAVQDWLEDAEDTLKRSYERATTAKRMRKFDNRKLIIHCLAEFDKHGATHAELLAKLCQHTPAYRASNLKGFLDKLCSSEHDFVLVRNENSGRYSFSSPMLNAYVKMLIQRQLAEGPRRKRQAAPPAPKTIQVDIAALLEILVGRSEGQARPDFRLSQKEK